MVWTMNIQQKNDFKFMTKDPTKTIWQTMNKCSFNVFLILLLMYLLSIILISPIVWVMIRWSSLGFLLSMPFDKLLWPCFCPIPNSFFSVYEILSIYNFDFTNSFSDYSLKPSHQGFKNYQMVIFKTTLLHQKSALTF